MMASFFLAEGIIFRVDVDNVVLGPNDTGQRLSFGRTSSFSVGELARLS